MYCRMRLPSSHGLPNEKIMAAYLAGWFPVAFVGSLRQGKPVVFHPAHRRIGTS